MPKLSVIILSYNTRDLTLQCIRSLLSQLKRSPELSSEVIVVDNGSADQSAENIKTQISTTKETNKKSNVSFQLIENKKNVGYPKGNNQGVKKAKGDYVLFLNSDVIVDDVDFGELIKYLNENPDVGVLTVRVKLNGGIDWASHRGFPTPWNAFCYFLKLERLFGGFPLLNRILGGYHQTYKNLNTLHEVDSPSGAFYMTRKRILDENGGFDESFFMYGEDLDLSYRIKRSGWKIVYDPRHFVTHLKYASGLKKGDPGVQRKTRLSFYRAMSIFYQKHYRDIYPSWFNRIVSFTIALLEKPYA